MLCIKTFFICILMHFIYNKIFHVKAHILCVKTFITYINMHVICKKNHVKTYMMYVKNFLIVKTYILSVKKFFTCKKHINSV